MTEQKEISLEEQRLADTIAELGAEFAHQPEADMPTIYEDFFVRVFLPLFAGDENLMYAVTPEMWLNIAHSPFARVRVINQRKEELFKVPPMFDQSVIKTIDGTGPAANLPSVTDMLFRSRLVGKQGMAAMNKFVKDELEKRNFLFNVEGGDSSIQAEWNAIFARYGRAVKADPSSPTGAVQARPVDFDSQEFESL